MKIVALEEHYVTADVSAAWLRLEGPHRDPMADFASESDMGRMLASLDEAEKPAWPSLTFTQRLRS